MNTKKLVTNKMSRTTVQKIAKKIVRKLLDKKAIARIHALAKKGVSQRAIAEAVGCSRSGVFYQLHK